MEGQSANYLVFSDVHLGADLVQHVRPWTISRLKQVAKIDRDLCAMLDFYRVNRDPDRPWRLIIAGDLIDFIGISIAPLPTSPLATELTDEERVHGLGSAGDHAALKMRAVASRHILVFERLARFIADGHTLVLVRGNHDIDFHWETARRAFVEALVERVPGLADDPEARATFEGRIEFYPWFYYVKDLLYVEHGHQFDAACNYPHQLAPIRTDDPTRISWSISDWLLRAVVRPTPGLNPAGHDHATIVRYLKLIWSLGVMGALRLGWRAGVACANALRTGRDLLGERARAIREEHDSRMAELAQRMRVKLEHLRELASMWPSPVSRRVAAVLRMMFIDRIALGFTAVAALVAVILLELPLPFGMPIAGVIVGATVAYFPWSQKRRAFDLDPTYAMRAGARRIARLLPTRFVIMGHTHEPIVEAIDEATTYVNLGHWGVDDVDGPAQDPTRTHLVLRWVGDELRAEFCRWIPAHGPEPVPPA